MQVLALVAVEMTIRRGRELMIVHHAVAVVAVAVAVAGEHEMVKL
jgi:predicted RNA-binding protein with PUA domain